MNTTEHLELIKAYCLRNLEIASKRTPGEWVEDACCCYAKSQLDLDGMAESRPIVEAYPHNAQFIALCAGAAEAGWRATIAAIDWIQSDHSIIDVYSQDSVDQDVDRITDEILAAYPLSLIQP